MDSHAVLTAAAALIKKHGHCRDADARDMLGKPVYPHEHGARERSATGALLVAGRDFPCKTWLLALQAFAQAVGITEFEHIASMTWEEIPPTARELCERVWEWEGAPWRTTDHVLDAFERAKEYA